MRASPPASTARVRPPARRAARCAAASIPYASPHTTTLNSFLTLPFDACLVAACKLDPTFAVTRLRGEGGKFLGSVSEEFHPAPQGSKA
jgi:hypothetical protein